MITKNIIKSILKIQRFNNFYNVRTYSDNIQKIRNIGISAHIDAGKTTTTERMLYYSGLINNMGEVHHGNTYTDYMDQERERGITITSAAVTFSWRDTRFNLIDTPGHIDFTMEVERTLNVLDGVVIILDGSAGVEAQTLTVWRQADNYGKPRIVYVNKMDRNDADILMCCQSIEKKFDVPSILLQLPVIENGKFNGILDVLSFELIKHDTNYGKNITRIPLSEKDFPKYFHQAQEARINLIEKLSDLNDELANTIISTESFENISSVDIIKTLNKTTLDKTAVPVVLGSSYKNIGVQSLMDAIILYLPSPQQANNKIFSSFDNDFCGRAFKVIHDKQKGPLVFIRIYNGKLKPGMRIYAIQQDISETIGKVYMAYADDFIEIDSIANGNIAVVSGLKRIMSGNLITNSVSAFERAKRNVLKTIKNNNDDMVTVDSLFGIDANVPEPVFFCSIEPPSMAYQSQLDQALNELQREDPSLRVSYNTETAQTVLAGMGELHLDIIRERIRKEYKVEADLGPLQIAYRETLLTQQTDSLSVETTIGNHKHSVLVKLSIVPASSTTNWNKDNVLKLDRSQQESASNVAAIHPKYLTAIKQGIEAGFVQGPKINSQLINVVVILHWFEVRPGTSVTIVAATVTKLIQKLIKQSESCILEPIMRLEIVCPSEYLSIVLADLSRRRSVINNVDARGNTKIVTGIVPLAELLGYSTELRTISSGTASFSIEFDEYQKMSSVDEENAIRDVRGF